MSEQKIRNLLERLTGKHIDTEVASIELNHQFSEEGGIGYNQLNEMLLMFGFDRISPSFFKYLILLSGARVEEETISPNGDYADVVSNHYLISSLEQFEYMIESFNIVALLAYGNIEFAFKTLASSKDQVKYCYSLSSTKNIACYHSRQNPIKEIIPIDSNETYYLGYLIQKAIKEQVELSNNEKAWLDEKVKMESIIKKGEYNNDTYLVSDYMDVYVATSMREKHEFILTYEFVRELFGSPSVTELNLRYFDPTQAYCNDRIDKGLTEALMLKLAACTIYLVQEKDTFGKDSELASTLAQGKPVIAYVPNGDKNYADHLLQINKKVNPEKSDEELILDYLCIFEPELAWKTESSKLRNWIEQPNSANIDELMPLFYETVENVYNKRANTLNTNHPLGIQIDLSSGVACGVLVVRDIKLCAQLLRRVILNEMKYNIDPLPDDNFYLPLESEAIGLKEEITGSIYRIMSKNKILSNTCWNQYNNVK